MNIWWVVGAGFLALVGAVVLFSGRSEPEQGAAITATATTIKKNLLVLPAGATEAQEIPESASVKQGDTLSTSREGRGVVEMQNGSTAVLDYDSSMTIEDLDTSGTRTRLNLALGSVWARVEKVFGQGEYFEIKTRNAVAVVRGTSFGLTYHTDGSTTAFVSEGSVSLTPIDPVTGKRQEYKTLTIVSGNKGTVSANGSTSQFPLKPSDTSSDWYLYNNPGSAAAPVTNIPGAPGVQTPAVSVPTTVSVPTSVNPPSTGPVQTTVTQTSQTTSGSSGTATGASAPSSCSAFSETGGSTGARSTLKIISVSPPSVSQSSGGTVTLTGVGFTCATAVIVGAAVLDGESGFAVANDSTITFSASKLLSSGAFDIFVADSLGGTAALPQALTVTR